MEKKKFWECQKCDSGIIKPLPTGTFIVAGVCEDCHTWYLRNGNADVTNRGYTLTLNLEAKRIHESTLRWALSQQCRWSEQEPDLLPRLAKFDNYQWEPENEQ